MKKLWYWIAENEFLVVVLLLVALFRIPSLFEPGWYGDEGIYLVMGEALRKGLVWYKDIHDNKPPLVYLLAALTGSVTYFRLLLLVWMLATTIVFNKLIRKIITGELRRRGALVLFALLTTIPLIEGNISNAEIFMILPTIVGVMMVMKPKLKLKDVWLSGLLLGIALLFKMPALFEAAAIGLWIVVNNFKNKRWFKLGLIYSLGLLVPLGVSMAYYWLMGSGLDYLQAAFMQNVGYLSSWSTGTHSGTTTTSGLKIRLIILLFASAVIVIASKVGKVKNKKELVWLWFVFSLFGALLSERPYPHYLIQVVSSLTLMVFMEQELIISKLLTIGLLGGLAMGIVNYRFYFYPVFEYYGKFEQMLTRKISLSEYENSFDWRISRNRELVKYLRWSVEENERIFVWGNEPYIYLLSNKLPLGKYMVAYHIIDFKAQEDTINLLINKRPKVIITLEGERRILPGLEELISTDYVAIKKIEDATIFRRIN